MMKTSASPREATTFDDVKPLIELVKAGKLFEVQAWIHAGRPINPPPPPAKGARRKTPLEIAIDQGFHSMVEVLLKGGATAQSTGWNQPLYRVLDMRRLDLIELLVRHGYDPKSVDMVHVFHSWAPEIMEYFIQQGAEVEKGNPLAHALCDRIRTALGIFRRYRDQFPSFQQQADIALRYHCKAGDLKWVSLMLWAGADPYAPGVADPDEELDADDEGLTAVGWAALYENFQVFGLKRIRLDISLPAMREVLRYSYDREGLEVFSKLLSDGMDPNDQENGGCGVLQELLERMSWEPPSDLWGAKPERKHIDTARTRDRIKAVHLLARHGARWMPQNTQEINAARRSLLKLTPDYTTEFVWIMAKYQACTKDSIEALLRTAAIRSHVSRFRERIDELVKSWT